MTHQGIKVGYKSSMRKYKLGLKRVKYNRRYKAVVNKIFKSTKIQSRSGSLCQIWSIETELCFSMLSFGDLGTEDKPGTDDF